MKPTIWSWGGYWCCACCDFNVEPPEGTEDYIKRLASGHGETPQEAYAAWQSECDLLRDEIKNNGGSDV